MIDFLLSKRKLSHHHQQQSYDSDDDMDEVASEDEFESAFPISEALQDLMASGYESESDDDSDTELTKMEPTLPDVSSIWTTDKIDLIRRVILDILIPLVHATNVEVFNRESSNLWVLLRNRLVWDLVTREKAATIPFNINAEPVSVRSLLCA